MRGGIWRFWPARRRRPAARRAGGRHSTTKSSGYNIVVLAVAITVINILIAKALPVWSHLIQREKEAELIFRGLQYAEAIRVFEVRAQRLPSRLEELIEVKPRSIRRLWENPMTEDGSWGLVFQDQPNQPGQQGQNQGRQRRQQRQQRQQGQRFGVPGDGKEVRIGPIIGVYSPEGGTAIKVFAPQGGTGGTEISEWKFTRDLLQGFGQKAAQGLAQGGGTVVPSMNAGDLGKPWPPGITVQQLAPTQPRGRNVGGGRPVRQPRAGTPAVQPGGNKPPPPQGRDLGGGTGSGRDGGG